MKHGLHFVEPVGSVMCQVGPNRRVRLPVVQGILKHPDAADLRSLLREGPDVARKYTREALKCAAWPILEKFPKGWLLTVLRTTEVRPARRRALKYLLT